MPVRPSGVKKLLPCTSGAIVQLRSGNFYCTAGRLWDVSQFDSVRSESAAEGESSIPSRVWRSPGEGKRIQVWTVELECRRMK